MKAYTITCHDVYNYGASLQAYALQHYLIENGVDSIIINYKPEYLSRHFKMTGCSTPRFNKPVLKWLYVLAKLPHRIIALKKKRIYDEFTAMYLTLTEQRFETADEIKNANLDGDIFIAGSDQIWNTLLKNGSDPAFYLSFAPETARKISYAGSFATDRIYNGADEFVKSSLGEFDAVSVREQSAIGLMLNLGLKKPILVCDPVFLLNAEYWTRMAEKSKVRIDDRFILLYDCERSELLREIALELKRISGLKIVCIGSMARKSYWDEDYRLYGPLEFLSLIHNSAYVVSNSFHATAFSIIFKKSFFVVNRSCGINSRMRDFLELLGLSSRLISSKDDLCMKQPKYIEADKRLNVLIDCSKKFLNEQTDSYKL